MTQSFWLYGSRMSILADAATTAGQYDLVEEYILPGSQTPPHLHTRYSQQMYVLGGEVMVWAGDKKVVLSAGKNLLIPLGTPHMVAVFGTEPARSLVISAPSGPARLVEAVSTQDADETPGIALLLKTSAKLGDEILGPPGALPLVAVEV
jgi:mannose-6-phosphate isomerase-like protein (cupin superfamily)